MNGAPSTLVSPGLYGFFAFFLLGLALYLLMRNMNARMRRMSYRSEELAREAEAERAAEQGRRAEGKTKGETKGETKGKAEAEGGTTGVDDDSALGGADGQAPGEPSSEEPPR